MSAKAFSSPPALFDRTALRFNQAAIIVLVLTAFVTNQHWLVAFVAVVLALGVIHPALALFQRLYRNILRPLGWLRPDLHEEDAAPHRFAQGVGTGVLLLATLSLWLGAEVIGWSLALLVVVLAAVNLIFGFCVGCFIFFQLRRLGVLK